ncbi:MAG: glycerol-3-phosphate acyltransferase [Dehalococcoidales bacterium]|nr:glycerol-3-phosphate acyltransferase [Dehalococcoidales bacterium]
MEAACTAWLAASAFILGAIPFSILIGHLLLKKDITKYGDANPGAANVFRAGNVAVGMLAVVLDVGKGVPFVWLEHAVFGLSPSSLVIIAVAAVLGHAFSPFLRWQGGKAVAITFGVMLGLLPQYDVLLAFIIAMIVCLIFVKIDAWKIIIGAAGTLTYLAIVKGDSWEPLLMLCLLVILVIKHFGELNSVPSFRANPFQRAQRN